MDIPDGNTAVSSGAINSHALTTTRDTDIQMPKQHLLMNSVTQSKRMPPRTGSGTPGNARKTPREETDAETQMADGNSADMTGRDHGHAQTETTGPRNITLMNSVIQSRMPLPKPQEEDSGQTQPELDAVELTAVICMATEIDALEELMADMTAQMMMDTPDIADIETAT